MESRVSIITLGVDNLGISYSFYHKGLGFPTSGKPEDGVLFLKTGGVVLALYPREKLAEDIGLNQSSERGTFSGFTLAHNTRTKDEVEEVLKLAEKSGGKIVKQAKNVFWGGYSGYFTDPDGYFWEVAYGDSWQFNDDGSLVV